MAVAERVLITGAAGMIGSHLADRLARGNVKVVGTSYAPTVDHNEIDQRVDLRPIDVRLRDDVDALVREVRPSVIYHLAAQSYPTVSWDRPIETFEANVLGTIHLFEAVK